MGTPDMDDADREMMIRAWTEMHRGEDVGDIPELEFVFRRLDEARAETARLHVELRRVVQAEMRARGPVRSLGWPQ